MASLTITIGALTASVSADNAKASNLLTAYADSIYVTRFHAMPFAIFHTVD